MGPNLSARFSLLLTCFFLSGFAALLYETAWTREFGFVFGTSDLAVAAVLAAYMGGLALGAAIAGRFVQRLRRPVLVYGTLELGIALAALAVPLGIRATTALYVLLFGGRSTLPEADSLATTVFHLLSSFAILLPCTAFMGATLPLLARYAVQRDDQIGPRVGALYAINTAGAIAGTLCAAFILLPQLGLRQTVYVGVAVNALVFVGAVCLARGSRLPTEPRTAGPKPRGSMHWVLPLIALSGMVSFIYEILWTRLLGLVLGGSVYAFATMLAGFLLGITLGSAVASRLARTPRDGALGFTLTQLGIAALSFTAFALADRLPELASAIGAGGGGDLMSNAIVSVAALLPVTLCIGATFPFAVRLVATAPEHASTASARVYSWNTVGAIVGSVAAGFLLLPWLGFAGTVTLGISINLALAGAAALCSQPRSLGLAVLAAAGGIALLLFPPPTPWNLLRSSPLSTAPAEGEIEYLGVGRSATVLLLNSGRDWQLRTNGLPEAIIEPPGSNPGRFPESRWMSLLPVLERPASESMLVIGIGGGVVLEAIPSTLNRIDAIELEPEVVAANRILSGRRATDPLADPRIALHMNDARGALLLSDIRYDAIVSQPSHPWTAGSSHLYTRDFFDLVHRRLNEGGVFVQWIGLRFVNEELLRTLVATLLDVFPYIEVYRPSPAALLFATSDAPLDGIESSRVALRSSPEDFARFGLIYPEDIAIALVLDTQGARAFAEGSRVSTDDANLLASGSPRIGNEKLTPRSADRVFAASDPLPERVTELDSLLVVRRLLERRDFNRAESLTNSLSGSEREIALGWAQLGNNRVRAARLRFERALALDPDAVEAQQGLSMLARPIDGDAAAGMAAGGAAWQVVVVGRRLRDDDAWEELSRLDTGLAKVEPKSALYWLAAELRTAWRIEIGGEADADEALEIIDALLARRSGRPTSYLLRAEAALQAGRPEAARAALEHLAGALGRSPRARIVARRSLALLAELPADFDTKRTRNQLLRASQ